MLKSITIIGTLNTKGAEVAHLRGIIRERGHTYLVIDPGVLNQPAVEEDITRKEIARTGAAEFVRGHARGYRGRGA